MIVAGDFNDWRQRATTILERELGMHEVFETAEGRLARTYLSQLPIFALDRIYMRGLRVAGVQRHVGGPWSRLSDHVALAARLAR